MRICFMRATVAAALTVLLLGSCSDGQGGLVNDDAGLDGVSSNQAREALTLAATRTAEAKTWKVAAVMEMTLPDGTVQRMTAEGANDQEADRFQVTTHIAGRVLEARRDGRIIWHKGLEELRPGKPWLRIDPDNLPAGPGEAPELPGQNDFDALLAYLQGAAGEVRAVRRDQVQGVETIRYSATIDLQAAARQVPEKEKVLLRTLDKLEAKTFPADIWIDEQGRMRKIKWEWRIKATDTTPSATMKVTMDLSEFGRPVMIKPPPLDQTVDYSELLGRAPGSP
jgi:hypothetical protein